MQSLRRINVHWSDLSNVNLSGLANAPQIEELKIDAGSSMNDSSIGQLKKFKHLKKLWLIPHSTESRLSDQAITELKAALPDCKITVSGEGSSEDGDDAD